MPPFAGRRLGRTPGTPGEGLSGARSRRRAPATLVRLLAVACAAVAVVVAVLQDWGGPAWWAVPVLAAAVAASEIAVVHLQFGRQRWTFSLTEGALGAAWVVSAGAWSVLAVTVGVLVAQLVRHQPRLKLEYNVAQFALATGLGSSAAAAVGQGVPGAAVGMTVFFLANHGLVGVAVALTTRRRLVPLLLSSAPMSAVHTAGNSSIGLLAAHLASTAPFGLLGLLVPLVLLWSSYDQQSRRSAEARLFAELARGQEQATGRSSDVSAQVVLTAAARLLGGADVEMVLVASDGPVRFAGDETGVLERRRVDPAAFDAPWVVRALGSGGVLTGTEDSRPFVSAVVGDPQDPLAVLVARRPGGSAGFGRREVMLAQVLVNQAESWLQVADLSQRTAQAQAQAAAAEQAAGETARALGDLGAAAAPSLRVLHESADRLARLAATVDASTGVDDIVEELHLVERAVASLLGALALAAEPELRTATVAASRTPASAGTALPTSASLPGRPDRTGDWTTTGVLR